MSILAGMMIALGCVLYIKIGGVLGAFLFSIGLLSVVQYEFKLFTGRAGKLATKEIKPIELGKIWLGNLLGVIIMSFIIVCSPYRETIQDGCKAIMEQREAAGFFASFLLAIPCGMLMYMAVSAKGLLKPFYVSMCVMAFICGGFYHCVADMFYTVAGAMTWRQYVNIIPVTLGNLLGCNIVPLVLTYRGSKEHHENSVAIPPTPLHQDAIYNPDKHEPHQGAPR